MSTTSRKSISMVELEKRISLLEKAVSLLLLGGDVEISETERKKILSRLMDYIEGKDEKFIDFEEF